MKYIKLFESYFQPNYTMSVEEMADTMTATFSKETSQLTISRDGEVIFQEIADESDDYWNSIMVGDIHYDINLYADSNELAYNEVETESGQTYLGDEHEVITWKLSLYELTDQGGDTIADTSKNGDIQLTVI